MLSQPFTGSGDEFGTERCPKWNSCAFRMCYIGTLLKWQQRRWTGAMSEQRNEASVISRWGSAKSRAKVWFLPPSFSLHAFQFPLFFLYRFPLFLILSPPFSPPLCLSLCVGSFSRGSAHSWGYGALQLFWQISRCLPAWLPAARQSNGTRTVTVLHAGRAGFYCDGAPIA